MRLALNAWFLDRPATGSGQYVRELVSALDGLDSDLQIILVVPSSGDRPEMTTWSPRLPASCTLHPVPCPRSNLAKVRFEQFVFPKACASTGAHVAHVPYWGSPVRAALPVVVTIHDVIPLVMPSYRGGARQRLYTTLVSIAAGRASLVLTDSEASRQDILSHLKLPGQRVRSIPLATDDRYSPKPDSDDAAIRADYGLPAQYVLYLGGFDRRKNLATVFAAYRWAGPTLGRRCPLVVAGQLPDRDTPFTPHPRRLMHEEDVPEQWVHFSGFIKENHKPAVYRGAAAFVFPSRYEGFGLPPLEALACGTPVVGSDAGSLPETVGDGGILRPVDDAHGMAQGLMRLVNDDAFRSKMRRHALDQASRFSWRCTAEATYAAYLHARR